MIYYSIEQERNQIEMDRPHLVILGAGASNACLPNGDKNGKKLPTMNTLIETLDLKKIVSQIPISSQNFEDVFSYICEQPDFTKIKKRIEQKVFEYFNSIEIPSHPTIYDHLLLSLREKDFIATFNWDPLLPQAYSRNKEFCNLPTVLFLHGNVTIGYCKTDNIGGFLKNPCPSCGKPFEPSKLLFPIKKKNYEKDYFISDQWDKLKYALKHAFMITIFGYSAPTSDVAAIELMEKAWKKHGERKMEQIEIIDIKPENILAKTWEPFIFSSHYKIHNDFYNSFISTHPRRSGEAYYNQYMMNCFISQNPIPKDLDFPELYQWIKPYLDIEKHYE